MDMVRSRVWELIEGYEVRANNLEDLDSDRRDIACSLCGRKGEG
jgi:hypothetical protein